MHSRNARVLNHQGLGARLRIDRFAAWPTGINTMGHTRIAGDDRSRRQGPPPLRTAVGIEAHVRSCNTACDRQNPT